jgi:hypothetical protein
MTEVKGVVDYIKKHFSDFDTNGNGQISKLEIEKAITNPKLNSDQALAGALMYYYRNSLGQDGATLSASGLDKLTQSPLAEKVQRTLDKLLTKEQMGPQVFPDQPINAASIVQGAFGDCKFVSSLSAFAATPNADEAIHDMIKANSNGSYTVTFPGDTAHPVTVNGLTAGEKMIGTSTTDGAMYATILEKAYGQYRNDARTTFGGALSGLVAAASNLVHEGRLGATSLIKAEGANDGDRDNLAMKLLTGKDATAIALPKDAGYNYLLAAISPAPESQLSNAMRDHKPVTLQLNSGDASLLVATVPGENAAPDRQTQITVHANHAYSVLGVDKDGMVTVYDSHGKLSGADNSPIAGTNGKFKVPLSQLKEYFSGMTVGN